MSACDYTPLIEAGAIVMVILGIALVFVLLVAVVTWSDRRP